MKISRFDNINNVAVIRFSLLPCCMVLILNVDMVHILKVKNNVLITNVSKTVPGSANKIQPIHRLGKRRLKQKYSISIKLKFEILIRSHSMRAGTENVSCWCAPWRLHAPECVQAQVLYLYCLRCLAM